MDDAIFGTKIYIWHKNCPANVIWSLILYRSNLYLRYCASQFIDFFPFFWNFAICLSFFFRVFFFHFLNKSWQWKAHWNIVKRPDILSNHPIHFSLGNQSIGCSSCWFSSTNQITSNHTLNVPILNVCRIFRLVIALGGKKNPENHINKVNANKLIPISLTLKNDLCSS